MTITKMEFIKENQKVKIVPFSLKEARITYILSRDVDAFKVFGYGFSSNFKLNDLVETILVEEDSLITFKVRIKTIGENFLELFLPETYRVVQRREYTRVNISIPVKIEQIPSEKRIGEDSESKNISGGGLQILASKFFNAGTRLKAEFKIYDNKSIKTILEVLRVGKDQDTRDKFAISGKFIEISNVDQTAIIQLCLKKQLEQKFKKIRKSE